jgi:hypothetical protein
MDHLDVELAHRILRGQLDPQATARWLAHTDHCSRCRDLLANERAMMRVLELGDRGEAAATERGVDRLIERVEETASESAGRQRRALLTTAALVVLNTVLILALWWQVREPGVTPESLARELRISPMRQQQVVRRLDALELISDEPWIVSEYETVETLAQLIREDLR